MKYQIRFRKRALLQIEHIYNYYEDHQSNLGERFLDELDGYITRTAKTPKLYTKIYKDFRKVNLKHFPYKVIYTIEKNTFVVYAVYGHSQDPDKMFE